MPCFRLEIEPPSLMLLVAGNISIQIKKLEDAGYIKVEKSFKDNYPKTMLSISDKGVKAFESYVNSLKKYINPKK
jgi:DNA-binding MarR family transcriptional regulator